MAHDAYITSSDYTTLYKGDKLDTNTFPRLSLRASELLDQLTMNRIRRDGLATFDTDIQEAVKLATCTLTDALTLQEDATDGTGLVTSSEKIGSYNYTLETGAVDRILSDAVDRVRGLLLYTGLLYRGLGRE